MGPGLYWVVVAPTPVLAKVKLLRTIPVVKISGRQGAYDDGIILLHSGASGTIGHSQSHIKSARI